MNNLNRYRIYNDVVNVLMNNDKNASWNQIIEECDNNYNKAIKELYEGITCVLEDSKDYDEVEFYKTYLERVEKIL